MPREKTISPEKETMRFLERKLRAAEQSPPPSDELALPPSVPVDNVVQAMGGQFGDSQQRIAQMGIEWIDLMLRKNSDYGDGIFKTPLLAPDMEADAAIRVRMSDKISRLANLLATDGQPLVEEPIAETMRDLGAYCLLWLVNHSR